MGQLEWQSDMPEARQIFPLINFRSRERHQQDLAPLSYHRQGLQRKRGGKKKRGGGGEREIKTEYRKTERMRFARMKSPVRDNIVNLAARTIITRGK